MIGEKDRDSNIIEQMSKERKEGKGSTRRRKSIPDDLAIDRIISGLDIQEGNHRMVTMLEEVGMHKFMETHGLVKCTTTGTETTLSKVKRRREAGQKGSKGKLKEFAENRSKRDWAVVGREGGITFLEDWYNLGMAPKRRNKGPLPTESE